MIPRSLLFAPGDNEPDDSSYTREDEHRDDRGALDPDDSDDTEF